MQSNFITFHKAYQNNNHAVTRFVDKHFPDEWTTLHVFIQYQI